jgi:hypothetical protein
MSCALKHEAGGGGGGRRCASEEARVGFDRYLEHDFGSES